MMDPAVPLFEDLRIDLQNPLLDYRGAARLLSGALRACGLSLVMFRPKDEPTPVTRIGEMTDIISKIIDGKINTMVTC